MSLYGYRFNIRILSDPEINMCQKCVIIISSWGKINSNREKPLIIVDSYTLRIEK